MSQENILILPAEAIVTEKRPRGFACMDAEKRRELAAKGGRAAHLKGTAHKWTTEDAKAAGSKGGKAFHIRRGKAKNAPPVQD